MRNVFKTPPEDPDLQTSGPQNGCHKSYTSCSSSHPLLQQTKVTLVGPLLQRPQTKSASKAALSSSLSGPKGGENTPGSALILSGAVAARDQPVEYILQHFHLGCRGESERTNFGRKKTEFFPHRCQHRTVSLPACRIKKLIPFPHPETRLSALRRTQKRRRWDYGEENVDFYHRNTKSFEAGCLV